MSKRYKRTLEMIENREYSLDEATELVKTFPPLKFDSTVCLSFCMGVDSKKSDQMIRGSVHLPHGVGKNIRVLVFAQGTSAEAALEAGADFVGMEDLISKIQEGFLDFDAVVAESSAMQEVRKIARILGPRSLMPTPKSGTVTDDVAKAVKEIKLGKVDYKLDKNSNISGIVGKISFDSSRLIENARAFIDSVLVVKPASAKGIYIKSLTLTSSMSCGVRLMPSIYS